MTWHGVRNASAGIPEEDVRLLAFFFLDHLGQELSQLVPAVTVLADDDKDVGLGRGPRRLLELVAGRLDRRAQQVLLSLDLAELGGQTLKEKVESLCASKP